MSSFFSSRNIDKVMEANSLDSLCDALLSCMDVLESRFTNRISFIERLQRALKEHAAFLKYAAPAVKILERPAPYVTILRDLDACLTYTAFKINACCNVIDLKDQLSELTDFFGCRISRPGTGVLSPSEANDILDMVQRKFRFADAVLQDKELDIYLINQSHLCYDSFLMTFKNLQTGRLADRWMIFSLSPCIPLPLCDPSYVFFHELGHVLYNTITERTGRTPHMFKELALAAGLSPAPGESALQLDENRLQEIFADLFSAAAMQGTKYWERNPYRIVLCDALLELLEVYFSATTSAFRWGTAVPGMEPVYLQ